MKRSFLGFGLLEVVISISIIFVVMLTLSQIAVLFFRYANSSELPQRAAFIAQEGIEAARFLRDSGWTQNIATSSIAAGTPYYAIASDSAWKLVSDDPGPIQGRFSRTIVFSEVSRDAGGAIVSSGGTNDPNTRKIVVTLSWPDERGQTATYSVSAFITNFLNN